MGKEKTSFPQLYVQIWPHQPVYIPFPIFHSHEKLPITSTINKQTNHATQCDPAILSQHIF